jgi:4-aminobutyrate aminotransferase / (S)-3-amino-2-methylpropionate transaminase / 5-aminovalerate transaminase
VLIVDEIQSGFARTGKMFAIEHFDIEADLITMSKSIAGGMPLSAITGRSEMMDAPDLGELGGTYGGSPVSCAAGLAVIQAIESMDLVTRSRVLGERVRERLLSIQQKVDYLGDVRGLGSMIAMEFVKDIHTREPDASRTQRIAKLATQHGLMLLTAGLYGNVIRLLYPLVITDEQLEEGLAVLEKAILEA